MAWFLPAVTSAGEAIGSAAGAVGSGLADVAGTIGSGLESAGSAIGGAAESAVPGLGSVAHGLSSLFGPSSEASYLESLGQTVPEGVELAGPSATFTGPGFASGLVQGFTGTLGHFANPSAATSLGQG